LAGSANFVFDGTNVGIGTTSPGVKLDVKGLVRSSIGTGTGAGGAGYAFYQFGASATASENWHIGAEGDGSFRFYNQGFGAGLERMRIDSSGNVGIGTSSPGNKLSVNGEASFGASIFTGTGVSTGDCKLELGSNRSDDGATYIDLHAQAGQDYNARVLRTSGANGSFELINAGSGAMLFGTNNTERMRIDSSGNVLVGTSTSFGKFSVFGTAGFNADANSSVPGSGSYKFRGAAGTTTITTYDYLNYTAMQFIRDNGDPTNTVGSITCTDGSTSYNTSSDYRLKNIDGPLLNSGAYIDALNPVEGWWKTNGSRFIGLLAHEVQEVSQTPIATGEKDGEKMQEMDYSAPELIANLIAEVQSMRVRLAQLEGN
jgi:hypothetical protein